MWLRGRMVVCILIPCTKYTHRTLIKPKLACLPRRPSKTLLYIVRIFFPGMSRRILFVGDFVGESKRTLPGIDTHGALSTANFESFLQELISINGVRNAEKYAVHSLAPWQRSCAFGIQLSQINHQIESKFILDISKYVPAYSSSLSLPSHNSSSLP